MPELIKKDVGEQAARGPSPGIRGEVRAVLDFSGIGTAIRAGSATLACRCRDQVAHACRWVAADWQFRGGAALVACVAGGEEAAHHPHAVALAGAAGAVIWVLAAWMHAPAARQASTPADAEPTEVPELLAVASLARRIADGRTGVHLAQLIETGELAPWKQPELKAALLGWGLPVDEIKLRFSGRQRVRDGVRLRDLPAAPLAPADEPTPGPAAEVPTDTSPEPDPVPTPDPR